TPQPEAFTCLRHQIVSSHNLDQRPWAVHLEVGQDGLAITVDNCSPAQLLEVIKELAVSPPPDPVALASTVRAKMHDKYDRYLGEELQNLAYAARALDVPGAWASLAELAVLPTPATVAPLSVAPRRPGQV
ncbi:hypothetical protein, partial [Micromonospora sp. NPDC023814]|uniref:hypothetical protein n=1 Tax=Micromonospora sp. NPDC023814 TaxID=3154596 RepID=UPI0033C1C645